MRQRTTTPLLAVDRPLAASVARTVWAVAAIAAVGWLLRAFPLIQAGPLGYLVDYDEGVYFASSSLLLRGTLPYRDFAFAHPPGLLYCLWPAAWLGAIRDPSLGFAASRWLFALIGLANVLLVGRIAMRWAGSACAVAATIVYATHPVAVQIERGPFLEPLLNLCCLWLAWIWLADDAQRRRWQALAGGALCGLAISVKLVGALWLLACALSATRQMRREWLAFFAGFAISLAAIVGPMSLAAPGEIWQQVVAFQLQRPPDGTLAILNRLGEIFLFNGQLYKSTLVVGGLALALSRARDPPRRTERFLSAAFIVILAVFLLSSSYWPQYNAHLALPESLLAGYAAAALWAAGKSGSKQKRRMLAGAAVGLAAFLGVWRSIVVIGRARARSPELRAVASFLRSAVPSSAAVLSFEPAWLIAAGRLPAAAGGILVVDSYASMLMAATSEGRRFSTTAQAFADPASQLAISAALRASRFAILGDRGHWQLSEGTQRELRAQFVQRFPPPDRNGIDVWEHVR